MSKVIGPPWRVVDRKPDLAEAMRKVRDVTERVAAQVEVDGADPVMVTADEWLALFDVVVELAERAGFDGTWRKRLW